MNQNYPNLEYIIIDGGSTDGSVGIIKKYEKYLKYWTSEPDNGQSQAINKGFEHTSGDLMTWLNSDDFLMSGALHTIAEALRAHPSAGAIVGVGQVVDTSGKILASMRPPASITLETLYGWMNGNNFMFMQPSCVFTRDAWERSGPLDETLHIALDLDLWIRMAKNRYQFAVIDDLLSAALRHEQAKTTAFINLLVVDCSIVVIRHGGEHAARKHLEEMAHRLSWYEPNLRKIIDNPFFKLFEPLIKSLVKPAARWRDVIPGWSGTRSGSDTHKENSGKN